jgi:hypothetical protein
VTVGVEIELEKVVATSFTRHEHAEEIFDGESKHLEAKPGNPVVAV